MRRRKKERKRMKKMQLERKDLLVAPGRAELGVAGAADIVEVVEAVEE